METQSSLKISKLYLISVVLLMLILPIISIVTDHYANYQTPLLVLAGKWFVFWAIGVRLLTAGLRQVTKPSFTAKEIFHIESKDAQLIVIELGFANICFGISGILSLFIPEWRSAAAFIGGLYMGIAGVYHVIKKPASPNEVLAMISDLFILVVMAIYLYSYFLNNIISHQP